MKIERFWEIVEDYETKIFYIYGTSVNDIALTNRTYNLQQKGFTVKCHTPLVNNTTKGLIEKDFLERGYTQVNYDILLHYEGQPPRNNII